jgi:hypothetical protein
MLAGTLGLPFATLVSAAYNNIFSSENEPVDMKADYRNWLADTFGKDAGEIIAHGGLRATGVDFASHLDFANLLPFSKFLADRRALKDRLDSGALDMLGPTVGAAAGIARGAQDISNGDVLKGLSQMVPSALKGPLKAADIADRGFTDAQGNKLPIEATGWDIFTQALNFTPVVKAEQGEAQRSASSLQAVLKIRTRELEARFARAAERGDGTEMSRLADEITAFNRSNPDMAITNLGGILQRRAMTRAVAEETGVEGKARMIPRLQQTARFANIGG